LHDCGHNHVEGLIGVDLTYLFAVAPLGLAIAMKISCVPQWCCPVTKKASALEKFAIPTVPK